MSQRTEVLTIDAWETIKNTALVAGVGAVVAAVWTYIRSVGQKADKPEVTKAITDARLDAAAAVAAAKVEAQAAVTAIKLETEKRLELIERRISLWDQKSERFVTREAITELEKKMDKMEGRIEASLSRLADKFDKIFEHRDREK